MAQDGDSELHAMADIVFVRGRTEYTRSLDTALAECQRRLESGNLGPGGSPRTLLLNLWTQVLQRHSHECLSGLLVLLRSYGTASSADWIRRQFETHVDTVAAELAQKLIETRVAGAGASSSERKRLSNVVTAIKSGATRDLVDARASVASRESAGSAAARPEELDDRLPLRRRGAFDRDLADRLDARRTSGEPLALVMLDLDHFKNVNDQHGHVAGDEVLLAVAEIVARRIKGKGFGYRFGGEELVVLLPNYSTEEAVGLAERVRKDIEAAVVGGRQLKVTASLGVGCAPDDGTDPKALLEKVDAALYEAKGQGRNCVRAANGRAPSGRP